MQEKDLNKEFAKIVNWAKTKGCPIIVHKDLEVVNGSNGYFTSDPTPRIEIAIKNRPIKNSILLIIHEFCHFWQWKTGFMNNSDDFGNSIYSKILEGDNVSDWHREIASRIVRKSEYDCEMRAAFLCEKWGYIGAIFSLEELIDGANSYNAHTCWSIGGLNLKGRSKFLPSHDKCADAISRSNRIGSRWKTDAEIVAPISKEEYTVFDKEYKNRKFNY